MLLQFARSAEVGTCHVHIRDHDSAEENEDKLPLQKYTKQKYRKMCISGIFGQNHEMTLLFVLIVCEELQNT